jgi:hypothetical protein
VEWKGWAEGQCASQCVSRLLIDYRVGPIEREAQKLNICYLYAQNTAFCPLHPTSEVRGSSSRRLVPDRRSPMQSSRACADPCRANWLAGVASSGDPSSTGIVAYVRLKTDLCLQGSLDAHGLRACKSRHVVHDADADCDLVVCDNWLQVFESVSRYCSVRGRRERMRCV